MDDLSPRPRSHGTLRSADSRHHPGSMSCLVKDRISEHHHSFHRLVGRSCLLDRLRRGWALQASDPLSY